MKTPAKPDPLMPRELRALADKVAIAAKAPEAGVAVTVEFVPNCGYQFCIWSFAQAGIKVHTLWSSYTDEARLMAHVTGFISNVTAGV